MNKKALILDLDNTIYSVKSIADQLFAPLFELIALDGKHKNDLDKIKHEIMRRPFQQVAQQYGFSKELIEKALNLLRGTTYSGKIQPFEDYQAVKALPQDKYLVTTGFTDLQKSKVTGLKIENDFKEIHIVDPYTSNQTKKEIFDDIIKRHGYATSEVLIIGDDPQSEIKAAQDLGIEAVLYDRDNLYPGPVRVKRVNNFHELKELIK